THATLKNSPPTLRFSLRTRTSLRGTGVRFACARVCVRGSAPAGGGQGPITGASGALRRKDERVGFFRCAVRSSLVACRLTICCSAALLLCYSSATLLTEQRHGPKTGRGSLGRRGCAALLLVVVMGGSCGVGGGNGGNGGSGGGGGA
ncbi:hypothetical protein AOQ84DRAFT_369335, partial [Glonium stellatum]